MGLNDINTQNGSHLFQKVETLKKGFKPIKVGESPKHLPVVRFNSDGTIEISILGEMTDQHYIEFIWVEDVNTNKIVLARHINPAEGVASLLKAKVPSGALLRPFASYDNQVLVGEDFQVP